MPGKIDSPAVGVWCAGGHYLGAVVNLTTGRALYCPRCMCWHEWQALIIGRPEKKEK